MGVPALIPYVMPLNFLQDFGIPRNVDQLFRRFLGATLYASFAG